MKRVFKRVLLLFLLFSLLYLFSCTNTEFSVKDENNNVLSAEKLLIKGDEAYNNKDYDYAIKYYEAVLKYYPDDKYSCAWANYHIGYAYYTLENYEVAEKYFNIVLEKYSDIKDCVTLSNLMLSKIETYLKQNSSKENNKQ